MNPGHLPLVSRPLPIEVRAPMEDLLGADLGTVQLHVASPVAGAFGARAFAYGDTVHFAPSVWEPRTADGWRTIGHELAHVLQQRSGWAQRAGMEAYAELEAEADAVGRAAAAMHTSRRRPVRAWYPAQPDRHVGTAVVQCLMSVEAFKKATTAPGARNQITAVDTALALFHTADAAKPRNYATIYTNIQALGLACLSYQQSNPTSKRRQGVSQLQRQITIEEKVLSDLADSSRAANPLDKWEKIESAQERMLASTSSPDFARPGASVEITDLISALKQSIFNTNDGSTLIQRDIDGLTNVANDVGLPPVLKQVIVECVATANVRQLDMKVWSPGAAYNFANGSTQKYTLKHELEQAMGRKFRLGSLLHELTHISIAESFDNTAIMLAISKTATDDEMLQLARTRRMKISALQALITSSSLTTEQRNALSDKANYPLSGKMGTYLTNFKPRLGTEYNRLNALVTRGMDCELIEYDTVVNQMALWCYLWGLPATHPVLAKLLVLAKEAYDERAAGRHQPIVPVLQPAVVQQPAPVQQPALAQQPAWTNTVPGARQGGRQPVVARLGVRNPNQP